MYNLYIKDNTVLNTTDIAEIWKSVKNFETLYEVSSLGRVRNKYHKIMKTYFNNSGYCCLKLTNNKKKVAKLVHRLVAEAFIPNPDNLLYKEVNHKNEDKTDNRAENLEWVTSAENKQHSIKSGRYDKLKTTKNALGKKHLKNTYSKYHNVSYHKSKKKWVASIRHNGKNMFSKRFDTEIEAALHVNWILDTLNLTDRPYNVV